MIAKGILTIISVTGLRKENHFIQFTHLFFQLTDNIYWTFVILAHILRSFISARSSGIDGIWIGYILHYACFYQCLPYKYGLFVNHTFNFMFFKYSNSFAGHLTLRTFWFITTLFILVKVLLFFFLMLNNTFL